MNNAKRYFLDSLKKINRSIDKGPVELNSINWYYQLYINNIAKSVKEGVATETTDKLLKRLTRFYIDNEADCKVLASTYQEVRRGFYLYKKHRAKQETAWD